MLSLITFLLSSFAVYACIKWWFDTDIISHLIRLVRPQSSFQDIKGKLSEGNVVARLLAELFECPWCLSFHFSLWLNIIVSLKLGDNDVVHFIIFTLATAGGGMFLWQNDLKD